MMKVLVCGGRDFTDFEYLKQVMDYINTKEGPIDCLIHGNARGADTLASIWASQRNIEQIAFPADWKKFGRSAGPKRNQQMLDEGKPDLIVIFPGGVGTADMVSRGRRAGIKMIDVKYNWIGGKPNE